MAGAKCVDCWPCGGAPIGAPTLLAPPNESVFDHYPRTTMLEWSAVSGATAYDVEVDFGWNCSGEFTCSSWANGQWVRVTTTSFTFEFGGGQPGRWRVRSVFGLDVGAFSSYRYFRYTQ